MTYQTVEVDVPLTRKVVNWHSARPVFSAFISAHPELGLRDSPITFRNFCYRHGEFLRNVDVMRKPSGLRSSAIFDINRFEEIVFDLLSRRNDPSTTDLSESTNSRGTPGAIPG